jgi:hypothetical protein
VVEAMGLLTLAGAAQKWVPMRYWVGLLGESRDVPERWRGRRIEALPTRAADAAELRAALAVVRANAHLPWRASCLAEAVTGQTLLRQSGSSGVVVIGLRPGAGGPDDRWDAHAWLLGREGALTGGAAARGFTATAVYSLVGGLAAADVDLPAPGAQAG